MVAAGALVRLVGCQAVRPLGVRGAALQVRVGSERAGAGAEWSLHLCCIKGLHSRHARAPRNTAGGNRHTGPAQGKHPPKTPHPPTGGVSCVLATYQSTLHPSSVGCVVCGAVCGRGVWASWLLSIRAVLCLSPQTPDPRIKIE